VEKTLPQAGGQGEPRQQYARLIVLVQHKFIFFILLEPGKFKFKAPEDLVYGDGSF
jgi:hypothetical protein